jgi:hypothetical protein
MKRGKAAVLSVATMVSFALPLAAAAEPTSEESKSKELTPAEALDKLEKRDLNRQRADELGRLQGAAYKTGIGQTAEWKAAHSEAEVQEAQQTIFGIPPLPEPDMKPMSNEAEIYRKMGGSAYKTGLRERAQEEVPAAEVEAAPSVPADRPWGWDKPIGPWLSGGK